MNPPKRDFWFVIQLFGSVRKYRVPMERHKKYKKMKKSKELSTRGTERPKGLFRPPLEIDFWCEIVFFLLENPKINYKILR